MVNMKSVGIYIKPSGVEAGRRRVDALAEGIEGIACRCVASLVVGESERK